MTHPLYGHYLSDKNNLDPLKHSRIPGTTGILNKTEAISDFKKSNYSSVEWSEDVTHFLFLWFIHASDRQKEASGSKESFD
jgi:hypothetical protein